MAPAADLEADDRRHKREEEARRAKRKEARENKSAAQIEKEQRRREHAQRVLKEQNLKRQQDPRSSSSALRKPSKPSSRPSSSSSGGGAGSDLGGSSVFQSLFAKRAEGFLIDLNFRNAPPRPPVGPCFVGLGLDGELNDKWTRYKPFNAVETNYSWKLHAEPDLGVPLAPSAMDLEGCYTDPTKPNKKQKFDAMDDDNDHNDDDDDDDDNENDQSNKPEPPPLHPDDAALIHWKGSLGDTAAEELQIRRDRARAAARLQGMNGGKKPSSQQQLSTSTSDRTLRRAKGSSTKDFKSRVLDEQNPFFMKKTTYLANDQSQSVHTFKSLAQTKAETAKEIEKKLHENTHKISDKDAIEQTFQKHLPTNTPTTQPPRLHPNKRNVKALYEIPLLPDVSTWGHTYTHVVLDNLPKEAPRRPAPTPEQLRNAFIADVERREQNLRMECNLLTPNDVAASSSSEPTSFDVSQIYDLDVIPLKEEDSPHVNFLIMVDEEKKVATYHPISSRVMLSMGRPADRHAGTTIIAKRALNAEDVDEMEKRIAEVDMDCAQKHGMLEEDDQHPALDHDGGKQTDNDDDDDEDDHREQGMTMSSTTQKRGNPFGAMSDSSDSDGGF